MQVTIFGRTADGGQKEVTLMPNGSIPFSLRSLISGEDSANNVLVIEHGANVPYFISATGAGTINTVTLGGTGATGDYLHKLILVFTAVGQSVATTLDSGVYGAMPIHPAQSAETTGTYVIDIEARSLSGGWKIRPGTGVAVWAIGRFTA